MTAPAIDTRFRDPWTVTAPPEHIGILLAAETLLKTGLHHEAREAIKARLCMQDNRRQDNG